MMKILFGACAVFFIVAVAVIIFYLLVNGVPAIADIGLFDFIFGDTWSPDISGGTDSSTGSYGIWGMIVASLYVTGGAIAIGVPIGLLTAIFLAKFCPAKLRNVLRQLVDLLAGIPSVVYGIFGVLVIVPWIYGMGQGTMGLSLMTASIVLAIMILPTIVAVSETAIRAVPQEYHEGSLALGATHERSVIFVTLPAAKSGVLAGIVLGIGRAIGETTAVLWLCGNSTVVPESWATAARTLTTGIITELSYASDFHLDALWGIGVVLLVFILMINLLISVISKPRKVKMIVDGSAGTSADDAMDILLGKGTGNVTADTTVTVAEEVDDEQA